MDQDPGLQSRIRAGKGGLVLREGGRGQADQQGGGELEAHRKRPLVIGAPHRFPMKVDV